MLLESGEKLGMKIGARITASVVKPSVDGVSPVLINNSHSDTHRIPEGTEIGQAELVEVVELDEPMGEQLKNSLLYSKTSFVTFPSIRGHS